jgi:NAD(P)H-hydrate epimerase
MTAPIRESPEGELAAEAAEALLALARARDVLAIGPGLGRGAAPGELVRRVVARATVPLVLDADALLAYRGAPEALRSRVASAVLTPHPGEAAALLGSEPAELNRDRVGAALRLAEASGAVAVLKGAATVVADPMGRVRVNATGGPVLAAGGSGDVLTGVIAALLAQGLGPFDAACVGAFLHGAAGDRLAREVGSAGVLASELAGALPGAAEELRAAARESAAPASASAGGVDALAFPEP